MSSDIVSRLRQAGCVFAEEEAALLIQSAESPVQLDAMVARRADGLPLEQVLGWAEFCDLRIDVRPGVFVPRVRTEFLVARAIELADERERPTVVLDLCCGSGALGAAVAEGVGAVELHAADLEPNAVACARENLAPYGAAVYAGDLFEPLPADLRGRVDLLLANVPYVPTSDMATLPSEAREHEPSVTLDGGPDGLAVLRRVCAEAPDWLAAGGSVLSETSEQQAPAALNAFGDAGLAARIARNDELEATVVIGTAPPRAG